ncbi:MFS transporter [Bradyrhizobium sp. sGM-13]|uniref:MFS transporter n=1 Tax=Bradyrhizobium sp. sGM-13 TaxID=2831781 RepID=UPI0028117739|nr:MFS transporter [Bradyrhizobium sp. sGM-13]
MSGSRLLGSLSPAFAFVLLMGVVDFFGDTTYSGGASMNGPFLGSLEAEAVIVSIAGGASEAVQYSIRGISGYLADKTGKYWLIVTIGYALNLLAVPAVALAGYWPLAFGLILLQGIGRGIRKPIIEAMLSYATKQHGRGWVYAVHGALDSAGRTLGPVVVAMVFFLEGDDRTGYALLLIPALLALAALAFARIQFPAPSDLEQQREAQAIGFTSAYWLYMSASACFAAGLMSFELIAYHLSTSGLVSKTGVPLFLAFGTGIAVVVTLALGKLYDRFGLPVLLAATFVTSLFSPFVFLGGFYFVLFGMALWGVGQVIQDMLLKAVVAGILPEGQRNLAFGLFYMGYGGGWLIGSIVAGILYQQSRIGLVVFAVIAQMVSLPLFLIAQRRQRAEQ